MKPNRLSPLAALLICAVGSGVMTCSPLSVLAQNTPPVRSQAVVNLSFDEASGDALDSATAGATKDNGALQNGILRVRSPFWGQSGRQAVVLDAAARQFVQVADTPD